MKIQILKKIANFRSTIIALIFMLAPIGNIFISFSGAGIHQWYELHTLIPLIKSITVMDWVWLGLLFITGVVLLSLQINFKAVPDKVLNQLSRMLVLASLISTLLINIYRFIDSDDGLIEFSFFKFFTIFAAFGTLIFFSYILNLRPPVFMRHYILNLAAKTFRTSRSLTTASPRSEY